MQEIRLQSLVWKIPWRWARQPSPVFLTGESHEERRWQATVHSVAEADANEVT